MELSTAVRSPPHVSFIYLFSIHLRSFTPTLSTLNASIENGLYGYVSETYLRFIRLRQVGVKLRKTVTHK